MSSSHTVDLLNSLHSRISRLEEAMDLQGSNSTAFLGASAQVQREMRQLFSQFNHKEIKSHRGYYFSTLDDDKINGLGTRKEWNHMHERNMLNINFQIKRTGSGYILKLIYSHQNTHRINFTTSDKLIAYLDEFFDQNEPSDSKLHLDNFRVNEYGHWKHRPTSISRR